MIEPMTIDEMKDAGAYVLANMAQCLQPDSLSSPGARVLECVRDGVLQLISEDRLALEGFDDNGQLHELCDDAPSCYTHGRWEQFLDLGAYQEDPEHGEWPDSLTEAAGIALYQICYRLATALCEAWAAGWECPVCGHGTAEHGCEPGEDGCLSPARALIDMVMERRADLAAEVAWDGVDRAPEMPVEALPVRTRGLALAQSGYPVSDVLAGTVPVSDPILTLLDRAEHEARLRRLAEVVRIEQARQRRVRRRVRVVLAVVGVVALVGLVVVLTV